MNADFTEERGSEKGRPPTLSSSLRSAFAPLRLGERDQPERVSRKGANAGRRFRNEYRLDGSFAPCYALRRAVRLIPKARGDNNVMVVAGHVQNGVVVLDGDVTLPEGAVVAVSFPVPVTPAGSEKRIRLPLVRTDEPGSVNLTGHQIAEILDQDDAASRR